MCIHGKHILVFLLQMKKKISIFFLYFFHFDKSYPIFNLWWCKSHWNNWIHTSLAFLNLYFHNIVTSGLTPTYSLEVFCHRLKSLINQMGILCHKYGTFLECRVHCPYCIYLFYTNTYIATKDNLISDLEFQFLPSIEYFQWQILYLF